MEEDAPMASADYALSTERYSDTSSFSIPSAIAVNDR